MISIAITSIFISVSFSVESANVQRYQITPYLRSLPSKKGSQNSNGDDWTQKSLKYNDWVTQLPVDIDSSYSLSWKHHSGRKQIGPTEVSKVPLNIARSGDASLSETLRDLGITNGENSKINYRLRNSQNSIDATLTIDKFLKIYKNERNMIIISTDELLSTMEAPEEESQITYSTNTGSRFGMKHFNHDNSHFTLLNDTNNNNTILLTIKPKIPIVLERVPSSGLVPNVSLFNRIKGESIHHRDKRAIASSATTCHSRHLHKCGEPVIQRFKLEPDSATKCKIREEFLDCMVRQRKEGCFSSDESLYTDEKTNLLRSKIKTHLWSTHGCLLF